MAISFDRLWSVEFINDILEFLVKVIYIKDSLFYRCYSGKIPVLMRKYSKFDEWKPSSKPRTQIDFIVLILCLKFNTFIDIQIY